MARVFVVLALLAVAIHESHSMPIQYFPPGMEPREGNFTADMPHSGLLGVDVSQPTSKSEFECLVNRGYHFAIVRAFLSIGEVDTAAPATITNAWAAGMSHVDVYLFPCYSCGNPAGQVSKMVEYLSSHGTRYGMIWLDVEGHWSSSESANREFFEGLLSESRHHKSTGVYTSQYMWGSIMGSYTGGSSSPLWYPHYDSNPSFSDFEAFGGWSRPAVKQYHGTTYACSAGIDENWEP